MRKLASIEIPHTTSDRTAYPDSVPTWLTHLAKVAGRKTLARDLEMSKTLLDQMLSGERPDLQYRLEKLLRAAVKHCGPQMAVIILADLAKVAARAANE